MMMMMIKKSNIEVILHNNKLLPFMANKDVYIGVSTTGCIKYLLQNLNNC